MSDVDVPASVVLQNLANVTRPVAAPMPPPPRPPQAEATAGIATGMERPATPRPAWPAPPRASDGPTSSPLQPPVGGATPAATRIRPAIERPVRNDAAAAPRVPIPAENPALAAWRDERAQAEAAAPGMCHICRGRAARWSCYGCDARVCLSDRWTMFGLCRRCARPEDLRRWHQVGRVEDANWLATPANQAAPTK